MNSSLDDEITSINAIYSDSILKKFSNTNSPESALCILETSVAEYDFSLRLDFPPDYPDCPPSILGTQTVGESIPRGQGQSLVDLSREILAETFQPGSPCIFDLLEELQTKLPGFLRSVGAVAPSKAQDYGQSDGQTHRAAHDVDGRFNLVAQESADLGEEPPWVLSEVVTEKKSVFVARAAHVESPKQAQSYLHHLLSTDKKAAKATHNITAWRISGANETAYQDCDDDGETAAGGRLLHLLQLMDVWNVMIVVTRWYGGVHLGPDRFRLINSVARDALVRGNFVAKSSKSGKHDPSKR